MTTEITVEGMSCDGCERTVVEALESIEGITDASADHETDRATVEGDADVDDLVSAVRAAGYDAWA